MTNTRQQLPKTLYQYRPPEEWAFRNLREHILYFGAPRKFNDPYDFRIPFSINNLTDKQFALARHWNNPRDTSNESVLRHLDAALRNTQSGLCNLAGVACFSKHHENLLMWSQYAGHGKGFCLKFDTNALKESLDEKLLLDKEILPVTYSAKLPNIVKAWEDGSDRAYLEFFSHKSEYWRYEDEWRIFKKEEGPMSYKPNALEAVYLGTEIEKGAKELISAIVREKYPLKTKIFQGKPSKSEFQTEFAQ